MIASDESIEWLVESPLYSEELNASVAALCECGYTFCRIASDISDTDSSIEMLARWLPVYAQGKIESYFYPRTRDNLFHRTIVVAPGLISLGSSSVGFHLESDITFLNINPEMANAAAREFRDYIDKCMPLAVSFKLSDGIGPIIKCLERCVKLDGNRVEKCIGLPQLSIPLSVIERIYPLDDEYRNRYGEVIKAFRYSLQNYRRTDIIALETPENVITGKAVIPVSRFIKGDNICYYSPAEYVNHLESILSLMKEYPDYDVFISDDEKVKDLSMDVIEGSKCILLRTNEPVTAIEISERNFIASTYDFVMNMTKIKYEQRTSERLGTIDRIRELINKIKKNKLYSPEK